MSYISSDLRYQVRRPVFQRIFWDLGPGHRPDISLEKYKTVIKLLVAATVGCQGAKTEFLRLFASESTTNTPPHALQHTAGTTPLSGTPCEFTGRVW
jgi:hypothetical protein